MFFFYSCDERELGCSCCGSRCYRTTQTSCASLSMHVWFLVFRILSIALTGVRASCLKPVHRKYICQSVIWHPGISSLLPATCICLPTERVKVSLIVISYWVTEICTCIGSGYFMHFICTRLNTLVKFLEALKLAIQHQHLGRVNLPKRVIKLIHNKWARVRCLGERVEPSTAAKCRG